MTEKKQVMRSDAPKIRTGEELMRRYEQLYDAQEREAVTPKQAEQLNMTLKGVRWFAEIQLRYMTMMAKYKKDCPVPTGMMLRSTLGLPEPQAKADGPGYILKEKNT